MYIRVENEKVTGTFWDEDMNEELKNELIQVDNIPMPLNNHSQLCFDGNVFYYVDISNKVKDIEELPQNVLKSIKEENEKLKKQLEEQRNMSEKAIVELTNLIMATKIQ